MKRPNFLIVGAAKCGTTSLHSYLSQHPDIFMPQWKEPSYFCGAPNSPFPRVKDWHAYCRLFSRAEKVKAAGEASTCYLYDQASPGLIESALGGVAIIIVLRNPVEMAYSLYKHQLSREGETMPSFERGLAEEEKRYRSHRFKAECYGWHANYYYYRRGLYYRQVKRYLNRFGREKVTVFLFDDLAADPVGLAQQAYRALAVDEGFRPQADIINRSGEKRDIPKFWKDASLLRKTVAFVVSQHAMRKISVFWRKRNISAEQELRGDTARMLARRYRNDIDRLEDLIQRDLSGWKRAYSGATHD